ncbi:MAG: MFS transporter [Chthoniobacteraceae bacterium]
MKIPHLRWVIAFALLLAAVLNYIDRSVLGLLAKTIQEDLHISDRQYAFVINCFLLAYTVAYLLSGRIVDKLGVRVSLAIFVGWWSISNALTGVAQSLRSLSVFRFMLGLGEAGAFTASPKAVSEWFPPSERGIAIGLYSIGSALGATIAPILVAHIAVNYGWRWVFAVSPMLGGMWLICWLWLYRPPAEHPRITEKERAYLNANLAPAPQPVEKGSELAIWGSVFRSPYIWRLMIARLLTDPVWYFYQFWMPKYLQSSRGLDQKGVAIIWMIFLAADAGFLVSGFLSGRLIKRGRPAPSARLSVMLMSACLVPVSFFIPTVPSVAAVIALGMLIAFAHTCWLSNLTSLIVDIVPSRILGTAFGVIACGSTLGGIFMNQLVAWFVENRSYDGCFYLMTFLHPAALLLIWSLRHRNCPASTPSVAAQTSGTT